MTRVRQKKPKVYQWENFYLQALTMANSDDPLHVAMLIDQILKQLEALGDSIYQEDGFLHYDLSTASAAASIDGLVKKLRKTVQANVLTATAQEELQEEI